jgi:XTP/dITP diphosphohydrolase
MMKLVADERLIIASHNQGKVREIAELLSYFDLRIVGAAELGLEEPEETGTTFAANAALKAEAAAKASGRHALADDSGLCVEALAGSPGIYAARWAGPAKNFSVAINRVEKELKDKRATNARAWFICALALAMPGEKTQVFEGRVDGVLTFPPRGDKGFGYDPIFIANGEALTFGEMEPARKHAISHRARAFEKLARSGLLPKKRS